MYRAHRRFIGPWWIFCYPDLIVNLHLRISNSLLGDHKGQYISLKPKRGKNKTRKLHIWHTTRKQMNKQGAFDVQITRNGYR